MSVKKTKQVKLTLIRSLHGRIESHKACAKGLGLRRIGHSTFVEDTPCTRGMMNKIAYLLRVEKAL